MESNTINIIPEGKTEVFHASQGDNGRVIRCNLVDGTAAVTLTGTESLTLRYKKTDGNVSSVLITNTFGTKSYVDIPIPSDMTDSVGVVYCKLRINAIGAKAFYLVVEGRP